MGIAQAERVRENGGACMRQLQRVSPQSAAASPAAACCWDVADVHGSARTGCRQVTRDSGSGSGFGVEKV